MIDRTTIAHVIDLLADVCREQADCASKKSASSCWTRVADELDKIYATAFYATANRI